MTKPGYKERVQQQTLSWAMGHAYHNEVDNECCPDFSCCVKSMFEQDEAKRWETYRKEHGTN